MNILAAISGQSVVNAVIWVIIAGVIYWLLMWAIGKIPMGEPFTTVAKALVVIAAVVFLINAFLTIVGKPFISW